MFVQDKCPPSAYPSSGPSPATGVVVLSMLMTLWRSRAAASYATFWHQLGYHILITLWRS